MGTGMMRGILTRFSLQKSPVTWRVIKIFAGCRWLKFIHQTAAPIVRYFLSVTRTVGTPVFIADKQRLNVALSRARNRVIIVGNSRYALQSEILKKVWEKSYSIFYETIESVKPALQ